LENTLFDWVTLSGLSKSTYLTEVIFPYSLHQNKMITYVKTLQYEMKTLQYGRPKALLSKETIAGLINSTHTRIIF
jgi:hypothetical protein